MSSLACDLERVLIGLDSDTARLLERAIRDALALAERRAANPVAVDALGYPVNYFETTAGSFAHEPLDAPVQLPIETRESW